jgi:hypothetical protein
MSKNIDVNADVHHKQVLSTCKLVTTFTTHQSHPFFLRLRA